ncbi:MAG: hypothetical protein EXR71_17010 [Myxococcales bacterium]|nr:hypothetical protein [Myxococcales bacterium]
MPLPPTRYAHAGGSPASLLAQLDSTALGLARARVAASLGDPDPFALRSALGERIAVGDEAPIGPSTGAALDADEADAVLLAAAIDAGSAPLGLWGLFAGRLPGPRTRAVPIDDDRFGCLGFPRAEPPPRPAWGELRSWSCAELGDETVATVRCVVEIPGGVALGSDYGLTLWEAGRFRPFPWPVGARREARRVEAMTVHAGSLWVATSQGLVRWDFRSEPTVKKHAADAEGGWDELRCLLSTPNGVLRAFRTGLVGGADGGADGAGLAEVFALAAAPGGVVYAGTAGGDVHVVGGGPVHRCGGPVRHLAFADGELHVAAGDRHHRFDGARWLSSPPEPTAFAVDRRGRLWMLAEGKLFTWTRGGALAIPVSLDRPWSLCAAADQLWIGGRERVWALPLR